MLVTKTNPQGMDINIQNVQQVLHDKLLAAWGIDTSQYMCYGRAYRNKTADGFVAEVYTGNGEYKEVYFDDGLAALSFFGIQTGPYDQNYDKINVHLVFFVDLDKLALKDYTGALIQHRADEEVRLSVFQAIGQECYGMTYQSTELYLDSILREYPGSRVNQGLATCDMQPRHCFRLNYSMLYDSTTCKPFSNV